jgi:catechol 2,3-dioxygenase
MVIRLAHVELGVSDLERSAEFYVGALGFQESERKADALYLRGTDEYDVWSLKLVGGSDPGLISFGFRVSSPDDLGRLRDLHDRLGLESTTLPSGFEPGRGEGLRIRRPDGNAIDFHHEIDEVDVYGPDGTVRPLMRRPGTHVGATPVALDHVNLRVSDLEQTLSYFVDELDFSISERVVKPNGDVAAAWVRRTRTHHQVAMLPSTEIGCHHIAYTLPDSASLLRTADILADCGYGDGLQYGPSRHGVSNAMTMYFLDPDGNRIEFYNGDVQRDLDRPPVTWPAAQLDEIPGGRFWWGGAVPEAFGRPRPFLEAPWPN